MLAITLLLLAGCGSADAARGCADMTADDGPPVLVEQRTDDPVTGPYIRRVSPDGRHTEYASTVSSLRDGQIVTESVEPAWRAQERLTPDQVTRIEAALRDGFFDLESEYRPPGEFADGFQVTWRACLDGRDHTVLLRSVDAGQIPVLATVRDTFELTLGEAAARAGERDRST